MTESDAIIAAKLDDFRESGGWDGVDDAAEFITESHSDPILAHYPGCWIVLLSDNTGSFYAVNDETGEVKFCLCWHERKYTD